MARAVAEVIIVTGGNATATPTRRGSWWLPHLALGAFTVGSASAGLPSPPVEQWRLEGGSLTATPLVVQLSDDDGDGLIGPSDNPDVLVLGQGGSLVALDGRTGEPTPGFVPSMDNGFSIAAGDFDGDGEIEIVTTRRTGPELLFRETDGTFEYSLVPSPGWFFFGQLGVADLDGDGTPEVHAGNTVMSVDGAWTWTGSSWTGQAVGITQSLERDCWNNRILQGFEALSTRRTQNTNEISRLG